MKQPDSLRALILAGGYGTRLQAIHPNQQKILVHIANRPFVYNLLDQLAASGIQDVIFCTGYHGDQVQESIGKTYNNLKFQYSQEPVPLGTGGALRYALPMINTDTALVMNGDTFCGIDLHEFIEWHSRHKALVSIVLSYLDNTDRYGSVTIDQQDHVTSFCGKSDDKGPGWINSGIYIIDTSVLSSIPPEKKISLEEELLPELVGQGFYGYRNDKNLFIDIGTPESFHKAQILFSGGR